MRKWIYICMKMSELCDLFCTAVNDNIYLVKINSEGKQKDSPGIQSYKPVIILWYQYL